MPCLLRQGYSKSFIKINLDDTPFQKDYEKIIAQAIDISRKTKGKIAWLWRFGLWPSKNDDFQVVNYQDVIYRN